MESGPSPRWRKGESRCGFPSVLILLRRNHRLADLAPGGGSGLAAVAQRETDTESGLVYMRNRMYDPNLGRFTQTDPILGNRPSQHYAYAANNPVMFNDPSALDPLQRKVARQLLESGTLSTEESDAASKFITADLSTDSLWASEGGSSAQRAAFNEAQTNWKKLTGWSLVRPGHARWQYTTRDDWLEEGWARNKIMERDPNYLSKLAMQQGYVRIEQGKGGKGRVVPLGGPPPESGSGNISWPSVQSSCGGSRIPGISSSRKRAASWEGRMSGRR